MIIKLDRERDNDGYYGNSDLAAPSSAGGGKLLPPVIYQKKTTSFRFC